MKRKIILNIANSIDGYIADEQGGYDWIKGTSDTSVDTEKFFSFPEFLDSVDVIIMGRKAYEDTNTEGFKDKRVIVVTSEEMKDFENVEFINKDIVEFAKKLQEETRKNIWLFGGGKLADNFIKANVVDEYIIGIIPIILGKGIPLFHDNNPTIELSLTDCTIQEGVTILRYVKR